MKMKILRPGRGILYSAQFWFWYLLYRLRAKWLHRQYLVRKLLLRFTMKRALLILLALGIFGVPELGAQRFSRCQSCTRDSHGKITRSAAAKKQFMVRSGFPHGRRGFQVDHIRALACGGHDVPANMQWLSVAEHRAKTKSDATCPR